MIRVYLHVAAMNHYREVVAELAGAIDGSGLYDAAESLTACTVGPADLSGLLGERWHIVNGGALERWEFPTLELIHADAQLDQRAKYLYLHTKGVSRPSRSIRDAWRRYMSWHVIRDWQTCVDLLDEYDTVGTEIRRPPQHSPMHYSGNFWWANGDYLETLPKPEPKFVWKSDRYSAETWLLESGRAKWFSFQEFDFPFWSRTIPEGRYRGAQIANGIRREGQT